MPAASTEKTVRTRLLVGSVGYRHLRDLSVGPYVLGRLQDLTWPQGVSLEDLSYGPVGVMHRLDEAPDCRRLILVAGVKRNRRPGGIYHYRWDGQLPDDEEIQDRVAEAVTGVISLDNLLIIGTYFDKLPSQVEVIEVEALDENWGDGFSLPVERALPRLIESLQELIGTE